MINNIKVNGFKSLQNFNLDLTPGLNILVGPNGSGKSNIIFYFEFLSQISSKSLNSVITNFGGIRNIFSKISDDKYSREVNSTIYGLLQLSDESKLNYEYSFTIFCNDDYDNIIFKYQSLNIDRHLIINNENKSESISILFQDTLNEDDNIINVSHSKSDDNIESIFNDFFISEFKSDSLLKILDFSQNSFLSRLFIIADKIATSLLSDFVGGTTFNIIPSLVSKFEDASLPIGINRDGTGLSVTLYALKHANSPRFIISRDSNRNRITYNTKTFNKILELIKIANNSIAHIDPVLDRFNNQIQLKVEIKGSDTLIPLPLSTMSDGTIKWMSLITALITSQNIFSIEEPENFLHPLMQQEIVKIMRSTMQSKEKDLFVLMTTHSESVLNSASPEEIVIIEMKNGITLARRIEDSSNMKKAINETGFGLGYYYLSNSF